jgi:hypothetical protein
VEPLQHDTLSSCYCYIVITDSFPLGLRITGVRYAGGTNAPEARMRRRHECAGGTTIHRVENALKNDFP